MRFMPRSRIEVHRRIFGLANAVLGHRYLGRAARFADPHARFVSGDAHQPCGKGASAAEGMEVQKCLEKGLLRQVFGFFEAANHAPNHGDEKAPVAHRESLEGRRVATLAAETRRSSSLFAIPVAVTLASIASLVRSITDSPVLLFLCRFLDGSRTAPTRRAERAPQPARRNALVTRSGSSIGLRSGMTTRKKQNIAVSPCLAR
jgi:hypothetical protein